ncbi:MAG: hypothetical protein IJ435_01320 [Clostridia bacterium]|nr:hypothetical protein [Clostridia bacterium]
MKISTVAYNHLNSLIRASPPETGGILGSNDGDVITDIVLDIPSETTYTCAYSPNVTFLNTCISNWQSNGKHFKGVFHSHFFGIKTPSAADKEYIINIMHAMPDSITELYFPIFVLPNRELICYKAIRADLDIQLTQDALEII